MAALNQLDKLCVEFGIEDMGVAATATRPAVSASRYQPPAALVSAALTLPPEALPHRSASRRAQGETLAPASALRAARVPAKREEVKALRGVLDKARLVRRGRQPRSLAGRRAAALSPSSGRSERRRRQ